MPVRIEEKFWEIVLADYVSSDLNIPQLSEKHGINLELLRRRSLKYEWGRQRSDFRLARTVKLAGMRSDVEPLELPQKIIDLRAQQAPQVGAAFFEQKTQEYYTEGMDLLDALKRGAEGMLFVDGDKTRLKEMDPSDFKSMTQAVDTILERRRIILSIPLVSPVKREIKKARKYVGAVTIDD